MDLDRKLLLETKSIQSLLAQLFLWKLLIVLFLCSFNYIQHNIEKNKLLMSCQLITLNSLWISEWHPSSSLSKQPRSPIMISLVLFSSPSRSPILHLHSQLFPVPIMAASSFLLLLVEELWLVQHQGCWLADVSAGKSLSEWKTAEFTCSPQWE